MQRIAWLVSTALATALVTAGVTAAQQQANYTVTGSGSPAGGTAAKPKPLALKFGFDITDPTGVQPPVTKTYAIEGEGLKVFSKGVATCSAAEIDAAQGDGNCPAKARIGTGVANALVGMVGQPASGSAPCQFKVVFYNAPQGHVALAVSAGPPTCPAAISQAIDAKWKKTSSGTALVFDVPDALRHQFGLDISVINFAGTLKGPKVRVGHKSLGYLSSVGCKDRKRDVSITFTDEAGAAVSGTSKPTAC